MSKEVSAALGTQRQFQKQPELPYALRLRDRVASTGLHQRADYDAHRLSESLGLLGSAYLKELEAQDNREKEQATLVNAEKAFAGKTEHDLRVFNNMSYLQHASDQFDLTDNKYAMAVLDKAKGRMASTYAKEKWADLPESQRPTSIDNSVQAFRGLLQENYDTFKDGIVNQTAFDQGYYEGAIADTNKVAAEAHQRINDRHKSQTRNMAMVALTDVIYSGVKGQDFVDAITPTLRNLELATDNPDEYLKYAGAIANEITAQDHDTERLNALLDTEFYGGRKLRDELPSAKFYQAIATNFNRTVAEDIWSKSQTPDGLLDYGKMQKYLSELPSDFIYKNPPSVPIKVSYGIDYTSLSPKMQTAMNGVGGLLSMMGYGDSMEITSTRRTPEHNAEVGGVPNSRHIYGEAVDIYVGTDLSQAEQDNIKKTFRKYFEEVDYHDAGSGLHLHLADYKGGLDTPPSPQEASAAAYSPDRIKDITQMVVAKGQDARRIKQQQKQENIFNAKTAILGATSKEEAIKALDGFGLDSVTRQTLMSYINRQFKPLTKSQKAQMDGNDTHFYNYTHSPGFGVPSEWSQDFDVIRAFQKDKESDWSSLNESEQKRLIKAVKNVNAYRLYVQKKNLMYDYRYREPLSSGMSPVTSTEDITETSPYQDLLDTKEAMKSLGWTDEQIEERLSTYAIQNGMDVNEALEALGY